MRDRFEPLLAGLRRQGADYADIRRVSTRMETVRVRNGTVTALGGSRDAGFGIRVLAAGRWGFAATDDGDRLDEAAHRAIDLARAAALAGGDPVRFPEAPPVTGRWASRFEIDPFEVPLSTRVDLLLSATEPMRSDDRIASAEGEIVLFRQEKTFASTEGSWIEQERTETGGGLVATALSGGESQKRSYPTSFGGNHAAAGWEFLIGLDLAGAAPRVRDEALELLGAPKAPAGTFDLVIGSSQMALQVHESVGHPTELDRVFGAELSLAGGSFLDPSGLGTFRYGSPAMTVSADATYPGGSGSFGYDDDGVPARPTRLVERGILAGFLSSRETAAALGLPSGGTVRAESWNRLPMIRMVNVNLEPGEGSLDDLVGSVRRGIFVDTNKVWSIDDRRLNFQFGCEVAREIVDGKLGRLFKNPVYTGITPEFWGRLERVAGPEAWTLWSVPNCGKGDPMQVVRVAHGASPALFRGVEMR